MSAILDIMGCTMTNRPTISVVKSNYRVYSLGRQGSEIYYSKPGWTKGFPLLPRERKARGCSLNYEENRDRAERRARSQIRRLILAHELNYMWSLTFADEVTELDEAWRQFRLFYRRLHRHLPSLKYVVVPELQKRGVWHFHMCVDQYIDHAWMAAVWGQGYVYVSHGDARGASRYLVKYLSKTFCDSELGEHRYQRSRNMQLNVIEGEAESLDEAWAVMESASGGSVTPAFVFCDPGSASFFAICDSPTEKGECHGYSRRRSVGKRETAGAGAGV